MKIKFIGLFFFCLNTHVAFCQISDKTAIQKLIKDATIAWTQKPAAEMAKEFWVLDEYTMTDVTLSNGRVIHRDAAGLLARTQRTITVPTTVEKSECTIHINGNMAFASLEQTIIVNETGAKSYANEILVLEKVAGQWKIHASSVHQFVR